MQDRSLKNWISLQNSDFFLGIMLTFNNQVFNFDICHNKTAAYYQQTSDFLAIS